MAHLSAPALINFKSMLPPALINMSPFNLKRDSGFHGGPSKPLHLNMLLWYMDWVIFSIMKCLKVTVNILCVQATSVALTKLIINTATIRGGILNVYRIAH